MVMASLMALTSITSAFACTGTIVGSDWTDDGSTIVARTEDISSNHAKNYIVHPRTTEVNSHSESLFYKTLD